MSLTAEEFAEVASFLGHAVWQIQILEETVAVHLVLVHKADAKTARRDVEAMFAKASKTDLGSALRDYSRYGQRPIGFAVALGAFCKRAELAHSSEPPREPQRPLFGRNAP